MSNKTDDREDKPGWGYQGEVGPDHWGDLNSALAACASGRNQSPIDISDPVTTENVNSLSFHYRPSQLNIGIIDQAVWVNYDEGSYIKIDEARYDLLQFHFHVPGEHSINGRPILVDASPVFRL